MTDAAWADGWEILRVCCQDREMTAEDRAVRSRCYRLDLNHLSDEQWAYAVTLARRDRWFPTIADLLRHAADFQHVTTPSTRLLTMGEIESQREAGRQSAREGLEMIEAELAKQGIRVPRPGRAVVHVREERLEELRAQAAESK